MIFNGREAKCFGIIIPLLLLLQRFIQNRTRRAQMDISQIAKKGSPKAEMIFHEDPTKLHIGTQPDHCYFIPFGKE